jgi:hypothetical protein
MHRQLRFQLAALLLFGPAAHAITIYVTYGSDVPTAAQTIFNQVVANYDAEFTNVTLTGANTGSTGQVNLTVDWGATGLGQSQTNYVYVSYSTWRNAMLSDSTANPGNTDLASGYASLPSSNPLGSNTCDPSTYAGCVELTSANARALGITQSQVAFGCINPSVSCSTLQPDSTLTFTNQANVFDFAGGLFNFQNVAEHELDEALAVNSTLTGLAVGAALPTDYASEDYFRYTPAGGVCNGVVQASTARCFSTGGSDTVYFSPDGGVTDVAQFFQGANADRNDWIYGSTSCSFPPGPYVQDAYSCATTVAPNITPGGAATPELAVLNTLGFNSSAPEPGTMALIAAGIGALLIRRKRAI